ncbi:hypothetical protein BGZ76_000594 [Entomortierella beljakovae]|nr:hypothetical protein BGZ76_000594 [Entomortierella beljakovae]
MGLPIIHQKGSKRKQKSPLHPSSRAIDQDEDSNFGHQSSNLDTLYSLRTPDDNPTPSQYSIHQLSKIKGGRESLFLLIKRQAEQPISTSTLSTAPNPNIAPTTTNSVIGFESPTTSSATPTATEKSPRQDPLSSMPVQFILGGLGALCLICLFIRCFRISRQYDASVEPSRRRHDLESAATQSVIHASAARGIGRGVSQNEVTGSNLVPTSELTLAARLALYQARSGVTISRYPYGQQSLHSTNVTRDQFDSMSLFVAPSYDWDVSPPPFMTTSGKPPTYAEIIDSSQVGSRVTSRDE